MVSLPLKTMKDKNPWMNIIPKGPTDAELINRIIARGDHWFPKPKKTAKPESTMETKECLGDKERRERREQNDSAGH